MSFVKFVPRYFVDFNACLNANDFISSFVICMTFISFSYLFTLAKVSSIILKKVVRVNILALFIILREEYSIFHL